MALVEILDVTVYKPIVEQLWNCYIDAPKTGTSTDVYAIDVVGWVLGRNSPAVAIELVMLEGTVIQSIPINIHRSDIAIAYPEVSGAENSGFQATMSVLGLPPEFELFVRAVFQDESRVPIGVIRGRRCSLHSGFQSRLQPLMVTSLGRTGTTWLMRLITEHPQIVGYRQYPYELCTANYWIHMLKVLSAPADHVQSADVNNFRANMRYVGHNPFYFPPITNHPQLGHWFGRIYVEQLAAFCQSSIEQYYQQICSSHYQLESVYFAEKYVPNHIPWLMWELYPGSREIFLIRDFRDMVCSMLAFNAKRGYAAFGREHANSDESFVQQLRSDALSLLNTWKRRSAQTYLLRYEDLILRPIEMVHAVLAYLDLDPTPSTIEDMLQRAWEEMPEMQRHLTSPDPQRSIGRWRHDLSATLQAACQEAFGDVLREFGYEDIDPLN